MNRETDRPTDWFFRASEKFVTRKTATVAAVVVILMCWSQPKLIGGLPWVAGFVGLIRLANYAPGEGFYMTWKEYALFVFVLVFELWVILEIFRWFYPTFPTFPL